LFAASFLGSQYLFELAGRDAYYDRGAVRTALRLLGLLLFLGGAVLLIAVALPWTWDWPI
jgi:hypothetical protein